MNFCKYFVLTIYIKPISTVYNGVYNLLGKMRVLLGKGHLFLRLRRPPDPLQQAIVIAQLHHRALEVAARLLETRMPEPASGYDSLRDAGLLGEHRVD